jgi:hypothetical protein
MIGAVVGRLTVVAPADRIGRRASWACRCECGAEKTCREDHLRRHIIQSCGCLRREASAARTATHGMSGSTEHTIWTSMLTRCNNPASPAYHRYGGRGIKVCPQWATSFAQFRSDMGPRPEGMSLDRWPNKDGNYEPGNCRWATAQDQARNTCRNRMLTFQGRTLCITEWAEEIGIADSTIAARLKNGWSTEKALTTPVRGAALQELAGKVAAGELVEVA